MELLSSPIAQVPEQTADLNHDQREHGFLRRMATGVAAGALALAAVSMNAEPATAHEASENSSQIPSYAGRANKDSFRIGSFNILGAFGRGNIDARAKVASKLIEGGLNSPGKVSIVGLQEVTPPQKHLMDKYLEGYQSVPEKVHKKKDSRVYIYVDTSRFKILKDGIIHHPFMSDKGLHRGGEAPWAKVKDRQTDEEFYFIANHFVPYNDQPGSDKGGAQKREESAHNIDDFIDQKTKEDPNAKFFKVGDDNSIIWPRLKPGWRSPRPNKDRALCEVVKGKLACDRSRMPYKIFTAADGHNVYNLQDSLDVLQGRRGTGPDNKHRWIRDNTVDFVYVPGQGWTVNDWDKVQNDFASDHYLINVEVSPIE